MKKEKEAIYSEKREDMRAPLKVFSNEELLSKAIEDGSVKQGMNMARLPGIQKQSIMMPDAHRGYGFPVGGVAAFDCDDGCISPGGIGYDINCGIRVLRTGLTQEQIREVIVDLLNDLHKVVHTGVGSGSLISLSQKEMDKVLQNGLKWSLENGYATQDDLEYCEENGCLEDADPKCVTGKAKGRGINQLGTLGSGNHFFEIQYVDKVFDTNTAKVFGLNENEAIVMLHCGSRGVGHQVCSDYLKKIELEYEDELNKLPEKDLAYAPLGSELANNYWKAMCAAANFGWANRQQIVYNVRKVFTKYFPEAQLTTLYDIAHNIAKKENYTIDGTEKQVVVHRKGATRAFGKNNPLIPTAYREVGQPVLIPGSMGTASYIMVGRENPESFASAPHGAGRLLSRRKAKDTLDADDVKSNLEKNKIHLKTNSKIAVLEEAPQAYKDIDEVIEIAKKAELADPVVRVKPIGVLKG